VYRIHRQPSDPRASGLQELRRYRCHGRACRWEGLLGRPLSASRTLSKMWRSAGFWVFATMLAAILLLLLLPEE
jgi:hypothetical protein